ncbi:MAG: DUF3987 domain-containing protein [Acetomicrobium sp.]|nr:DUF3987 domain-containing protein [Acetomicrobium sp.]
MVKHTLNASIDYIGSSLLWVLSLCIGNAIKIEIKKGWVEAGDVWIAIVGRAGIGKSHNIDAMTFPLINVNKREIRRYAEQAKKYSEYRELSKKEKENVIEVEEPVKSQFIVGDITLESFFDLNLSLIVSPLYLHISTILIRFVSGDPSWFVRLKTSMIF